MSCLVNTVLFNFISGNMVLCKRLHNLALELRFGGNKGDFNTHFESKLMEELKTDIVHISNLRKVKSSAHDHPHSNGSHDFHHQRVSVSDIIRSHYRRGK